MEYLVYILIGILYAKCICAFVLLLVHIPRAHLKKGTFCYMLLDFPCRVIEHFLHGGGKRWLIYNVGLFPSLHMRRLAYRLLGAKIAPKAIFHFRTEIREPRNLTVMGGQLLAIMFCWMPEWD